MKRWIVECAVAVVLVLLGAAGHADEGHHGKKDRPEGDHAAIGVPGDPGKVSRTIEVGMYDSMRFKPDRIRVKRGETVRFVAKNHGKLTHEMVLGTAEDLKEHAEEMRTHPEMEHSESETGEISVPPGKTGELVWRFTEAGTVPFACLEPGHYEAGMKGEIVVGGKGK